MITGRAQRWPWCHAIRAVCHRRSLPRSHDAARDQYTDDRKGDDQYPDTNPACGHSNLPDCRVMRLSAPSRSTYPSSDRIRAFRSGSQLLVLTLALRPRALDEGQYGADFVVGQDILEARHVALVSIDDRGWPKLGNPE